MMLRQKDAADGEKRFDRFWSELDAIQEMNIYTRLHDYDFWNGIAWEMQLNWEFSNFCWREEFFKIGERKTVAKSLLWFDERKHVSIYTKTFHVNVRTKWVARRTDMLKSKDCFLEIETKLKKVKFLARVWLSMRGHNSRIQLNGICAKMDRVLNQIADIGQVYIV